MNSFIPCAEEEKKNFQIAMMAFRCAFDKIEIDLNFICNSTKRWVGKDTQ